MFAGVLACLICVLLIALVLSWPTTGVILSIVLAIQIHNYSYSKSWEARVAAGEALGLVADFCQHYSAHELSHAFNEQQQQAAAGEHHDAGPSGAAASSSNVPMVGQSISISLSDFNIQQVLDKGTPLAVSGGQVSAWPALPNVASLPGTWLKSKHVCYMMYRSPCMRAPGRVGAMQVCS